MLDGFKLIGNTNIGIKWYICRAIWFELKKDYMWLWRYLAYWWKFRRYF